MIRWLICLPIALIGELVAILLAPLLPLFVTARGTLPRWLAWFDTPDNLALGDRGHLVRWAGRSGYIQIVAWYLRNRAYGLKWGPLGAPVRDGVVLEGDLLVSRWHAGLLRCRCGPFWQWKRVLPIPGAGYCLMLNFGWLLDDFVDGESAKPKALYLFSPRLRRFG